MIYLEKANDDKRCDVCGRLGIGGFSYGAVKEIHFTAGEIDSHISLCCKCRDQLVKEITDADDYGKLLEGKDGI